MKVGDMSENSQTGSISPAVASAAADSATLIGASRHAALATIDKASGAPYVSLVTVATGPDGRQLMLLSKLARHTQNLDASPRASLLFHLSNSEAGDPLALARVTLMGEAVPTTAPEAKPTFLAVHPDAANYAEFPDFRFFALTPENAHFIGGFGRIIPVPGSVILDALCKADAAA